MKKVVLCSIVFCASIFHAYCEPHWTLKKNEDGIKIYTAFTENSPFKSVKVECTVNAAIAQVIAVLLDADKQTEWVYSTKTARVISKAGNNELTFYAEVTLPWPCSNRDYIAHLTFREIAPGHVIIDSRSEPDLLPKKTGCVRVRSSASNWDISSTGNGTTNITYTVRFDPSGAVPPWLVNLFLTKAPFQTFENLRKEVKKPAYKNVRTDFSGH